MDEKQDNFQVHASSWRANRVGNHRSHKVLNKLITTCKKIMSPIPLNIKYFIDLIRPWTAMCIYKFKVTQSHFGNKIRLSYESL